jgi:hypothetical protein
MIRQFQTIAMKNSAMGKIGVLMKNIKMMISQGRKNFKSCRGLFLLTRLYEIDIWCQKIIYLESQG